MDLLTSILGIPRFLGVRWPSRQLPVLKKTDSFLEIVQNSFWCKGCKYSMSFTSCTITSAHLVIEQTSAFFVFFFLSVFVERGLGRGTTCTYSNLFCILVLSLFQGFFSGFSDLPPFSKTNAPISNSISMYGHFITTS